ncbi:nitrate reductase molybdenum cofactor assembly chaperone [Rhizomonospora bruguierae]|uniref:nitrate reductase molybdenum cofactor assembly chaperone n=1 Tax=Rhizomonospora bruguierae TaxID=1581705 RepID=UPI001BD00800|nr:nitrate reductase molybdenum cofactor assembly chaperone [Micromonospora sp. NBRC 107566]
MSAGPGWRSVAARAASLLLRYPDEPVLDALPLVAAALADLPAPVAGPLGAVAAHRAGADPIRLRADYVELFDFRRRCCLHLTYYTCGDTRRRGEALVGFAAGYRAAGLAVVDGELPDYLPAVLDLAAADRGGWRLLRENRIGLDLLAEALTREQSVYRHAIEAVRETLPAARPADLAAAARLARTGPPDEQVGLEPYGPLNPTGSRA